MKFFELVVLLQSKFGVSQKELADLIHTDRIAVWAYLNKKRNPTHKTMRKWVDFAKEHGIKVEYSDIEV